MGIIRGASAPSLIASCDKATLSQAVSANTFTQIAPLPAAQVNRNSSLNPTTGVFTPVVSGYYRISGASSSNAPGGTINNYVFLYQGSTSMRALGSSTGVPGTVLSVVAFSTTVFLTSGTPYHLRFFSTVANTITEMHQANEYVSP